MQKSEDNDPHYIDKLTERVTEQSDVRSNLPIHLLTQY